MVSKTNQKAAAPMSELSRCLSQEKAHFHTLSAFAVTPAVIITGLHCLMFMIHSAK